MYPQFKPTVQLKNLMVKFVFLNEGIWFYIPAIRVTSNLPRCQILQNYYYRVPLKKVGTMCTAHLAFVLALCLINSLGNINENSLPLPTMLVISKRLL